MKKIFITLLALALCIGFIDSVYASEEDKNIIIVPYSDNLLSES
mgnify:CR=1 FL=1